MEHIDVKFSGELSKTSKRFLKIHEKKRLLRYFFLLAAMVVLCAIVIGVMSFIPLVNENRLLMLPPIIVMVVLCLFALLAVVCAYIPKNLSYPLEVHFVENKVKVSMKPSFLVKKSHTQFEFLVETIQEVHDYGEFYYIISTQCDVLCQKNLVRGHQLAQLHDLFESLNVTITQKELPPLDLF